MDADEGAFFGKYATFSRFRVVRRSGEDRVRSGRNRKICAFYIIEWGW